MIPLVFLLLATDVDAGPRPVEEPALDDAGVAVVDAGPAATPGFTVSARLDPDPAAFGFPVDLVVTIVRPPLRKLELPKDIEPSETLPRVGEPLRQAKEIGDKVEETLRFRFLALDVKDLKTPSFVIKSDDVVLEVPSLPVRVTTQPLPEEQADAGVPDGALVVDAAAGSLSWRVRDDRPWQLLLLAVAIVVLVAVVRAVVQKKKAQKAAQGPPPPPPRPAWEVAIERLDALMPLLQQNQVTTFVEKMMDEVLRDYLAARFALATGSRTTKEIVVDLLGVVSASLDVNLVEEVGKDADLVKFARAHLASAQAHAMAGRVRALILATADKAPTTTTAKEAK